MKKEKLREKIYDVVFDTEGKNEIAIRSAVYDKLVALLKKNGVKLDELV